MSYCEPGYCPAKYYGAIENKKFHPYSYNGGSVVAIAGDNYAVIGADTRLTSGFSLITRNQRKLLISEQSVVGTTGCWADALSFTKMLDLRMRMYKLEHNKTMTTPALAQMLSTMLYYKRFFPYFIYNVIAGLDEKGKGCVFSYDPIGHCERSTYTAGGNAVAMLLPFLDNQVAMKNMQHALAKPLPQQKAISLLKDAFTSVAERDVVTGDCVQILTITASGVQQEDFRLRRD